MDCWLSSFHALQWTAAEVSTRFFLGIPGDVCPPFFHTNACFCPVSLHVRFPLYLRRFQTRSSLAKEAKRYAEKITEGHPFKEVLYPFWTFLEKEGKETFKSRYRTWIRGHAGKVGQSLLEKERVSPGSFLDLEGTVKANGVLDMPGHLGGKPVACRLAFLEGFCRQAIGTWRRTSAR